MTEAASGYERQSLEKYFTPAWVTEALMSSVGFPLPIWDPAGGAGHIVRAIKGLGFAAVGSDIEPDHADISRRDFFELPPDVDSIVTNPPFGAGGRLAVKFIDTALNATLARSGKVAMLLRVDFDSAGGRRRVFADHPAFAAKYVLTRRIRWANLPQSAAGPTQNHAWFVWDWAKAPSIAPRIGYLPLAKAAA